MIDARVLILDDDEMVAAALHAMSQGVGAQARATTEPESFFAALESWQPTHILLDLNMPNLDGMQVMAELASREIEAGIIVVSGVGRRVIDAAARTAAARGLRVVGVLDKPFLLEDLEHLLESDAALSVPLAPAVSTRRAAAVTVTVAEIGRALERGELFLAFQPKVECRTRTLAGFEALVRWQHPEHGVVMPDRFIPVAEESGLIDALTMRVVDLGLAWLAGWHDADGIDANVSRAANQLTLSINVSPHSLGNAGLVEEIEARCAVHGIAPTRVILELTETATMADPVASLDLLTRLRAKGFLLAIDDFGTGFSSMVQLVRLPFSEIKVDKSFVMTSGTSLESRKVIRSVVELGRSLSLTTTAEGVEDEEVLALLRDLGCDLAQGYLESRPLPAEAAREWTINHLRADEARRLVAVEDLGVLDTPPTPHLDRLAQLASESCATPMALVSLVDAHRQWFKAACGCDFVEFPRGQGFCPSAVLRDDVLVVPDATRDPRFQHDPLVVGGPRLRFYAGVPLHGRDGSRVGALCVLDVEPRELARAQLDTLVDIARQVERELTDHRGTHAAAYYRGPFARDLLEERMRAALKMCRRFRVDTALVILEPKMPEPLSDLSSLSELVEGNVRGADPVGDLGPGRIGALLLGCNGEGAMGMCQRLVERVDVDKALPLAAFEVRIAVSFAREPLDLELLLRAAAACSPIRLGAAPSA